MSANSTKSIGRTCGNKFPQVVTCWSFRSLSDFLLWLSPWVQSCSMPSFWSNMLKPPIILPFQHISTHDFFHILPPKKPSLSIRPRGTGTIWDFPGAFPKVAPQLVEVVKSATIDWTTGTFGGRRNGRKALACSGCHGGWESTIEIYTGWWFEPLWKIFVNWDDYSQYMGK